MTQACATFTLAKLGITAEFAKCQACLIEGNMCCEPLSGIAYKARPPMRTDFLVAKSDG